MSKKTAIMGFGNPVRSDDAIGIYVIEKLRKEIEDQSHVSLLDMGTSAFEVLFKLKGHERIILVDAVVNTGEAVGTLYKVPAEEIRRAPVDDPMVFLHSIKWDQALSYAKKILQHEYPEDIVVYLIAVDNTRLDIELSEAAQQAGDKVVALIKKELTK
jgi:hydrogenase maturation protease